MIVNIGFAPSKGEARRLVMQGGVTINNEKLEDINSNIIFDKEIILKVGKRKFIRIKSKH
jgi:tyrosyl-tRNA synthetase